MHHVLSTGILCCLNYYVHFNLKTFVIFRQTLFEFDSKIPNKEDDLYHFVGYVPIDGRLYELDGLKSGPIDLGAIPPDSDWLDVVRPIIDKRINK